MLSLFGRIYYLLSHWRKNAIGAYLNKKFNRKINNGKGTVRFNGISVVSGADKITAGNNIHIGNNAYIAAEGGLTIGDNVHVSRNMVLYTHNHNYEGVCLPYDNTHKYNPVTIGNNVWIGMNVTILPGTTIADGAIIGAGSVVAGTVEKGEIVGAHTAQILKQRNMDHYNTLEQEGKYGGASGKPIQP